MRKRAPRGALFNSLCDPVQPVSVKFCVLSVVCVVGVFVTVEPQKAAVRDFNGIVGGANGCERLQDRAR